MRLKLLVLFLFLSYTAIYAQLTFKAGWNTYHTGMIIHEYTYNYSNKDAIKLSIIDSTEIYVTPDSMVAMTVGNRIYEHETTKKVNYMNSQKKVEKSEEYKNSIVENTLEWKYDDKNRKAIEFEENKGSGNKYKRQYDYTTDKSTGDQVITETAYLNNRIEYYTKSYYDKKNVKYKEVRLNDNNKDVMHVETYTYGTNGKLSHRSVFFPQFKVTKEFDEPDGSEPDKCFKSLPGNIPEKVSLATKTEFLKKLITKNLTYLTDPTCEHYEFKFICAPNCEVVIKTTKVNRNREVILRFKEKM